MDQLAKSNSNLSSQSLWPQSKLLFYIWNSVEFQNISPAPFSCKSKQFILAVQFVFFNICIYP